MRDDCCSITLDKTMKCDKCGKEITVMAGFKLVSVPGYENCCFPCLQRIIQADESLQEELINKTRETLKPSSLAGFDRCPHDMKVSQAVNALLSKKITLEAVCG